MRSNLPVDNIFNLIAPLIAFYEQVLMATSKKDKNQSKYFSQKNEFFKKKTRH